MRIISKCERRSAAVPHECCLMGLSTGEIGRLAAEGAYQLMERKMDEKLMGVIRHVLTAVGAVVVYLGYTDDATWVTTMGAIMTMVPFVWSWMSKDA